MATRNKDPGALPPRGAFSSRGDKAPPDEAPPRGAGAVPRNEAPPRGAGAGAMKEPAPRKPEQASSLDDLFEPVSGPPPGAGELALEELTSNSPRRQSSQFPNSLGQSEGHDAWTLERMSRQSTVPPVRSEEVDRLRELATRSSLLPEPLDDQDGGAFDLVNRAKPSLQPDLVGEMEELYALDDLTGALRFAELVLGREPENPQARRCAENCRRRLLSLYSSKIGDLSAVPVPALDDTQLRWLGLDHRAGFLLSRVDGLSTVEEVLDICGMPRLEALKTLVDLLDRGAIRVERR